MFRLFSVSLANSPASRASRACSPFFLVFPSWAVRRLATGAAGVGPARLGTVSMVLGVAFLVAGALAAQTHDASPDASREASRDASGDAARDASGDQDRHANRGAELRAELGLDRAVEVPGGRDARLSTRFRRDADTTPVSLESGAVVRDAALQGAVTIKVFCDQGESIQEALLHPAVELNIEVRGFCAESVEIRRDRVTLSGEDPAIDGIDAPADDDLRAAALRIREARRVRVKNLTLRGGSFEGLRVLQSTDGIYVENVHLEGNGVRGGTVLDSIVTMARVTVTGNGTDPDDGNGGYGGLLTSGSAWLWCDECSIHTNPERAENTGIRALRGSQVSLTDSFLEGRYGVVAHASEVFVRRSWTEGLYAAVADGHARVTFAEQSFEGILVAYDDSTIELFEAKQSAAAGDNLAFGGSTFTLAAPRPEAAVPTVLLQPLWMSNFSRATVFPGAQAPELQCSLGADAVCAEGALVGASTCGQCPIP